jgi:hypothetical protein
MHNDEQMLCQIEKVPGYTRPTREWVASLQPGQNVCLWIFGNTMHNGIPRKVYWRRSSGIVSGRMDYGMSADGACVRSTGTEYDTDSSGLGCDYAESWVITPLKNQAIKTQPPTTGLTAMAVQFQAILAEYSELKQRQDDGFKRRDSYVESIADRLGVPLVDDYVELLRSVDAEIDRLKAVVL